MCVLRCLSWAMRPAPTTLGRGCSCSSDRQHDTPDRSWPSARPTCAGTATEGSWRRTSSEGRRPPESHRPGGRAIATVSVRYIVDDVDESIRFYCDRLGFTEVMHPAPSFAMLERGDLRLVLSAPGGAPGGGQAMPDGTLPEPGGWNRFSLEVENLDEVVAGLTANGAHFRNDIVEGVGGRQILVDDPSGNPVELFEPTLPEARLDRPR